MNDPEISAVLEKIDFKGTIRFHEPMAPRTTFRVGGPADCLLEPTSVDETCRLLQAFRTARINVFILGGGSNLLVSDKGIREPVINTKQLASISVESEELTTESGADVSTVCEKAADAGLSGMEFIYGMPGTIGGAIWMNARCYGTSISDILTEATYADENGKPRTYTTNPSDFTYKVSPFQQKTCIILNARFKLKYDSPVTIRKKMKEHIEDRTQKGHFQAPCAGSVFKNNREFGSPTGVILDKLGLKNASIGGACIAPYHANIIINEGTAEANDIFKLIQLCKTKAKQTLGIELEPEIRLAGDWSQETC